jgi:nitric oxide reductase NorQ protein
MVLTEKDNEIIPRHPLSYVIISMNPFSVEFAGTKPLNAAFRRRLSVWINFDYLSVGQKLTEDEISLIENKGRVNRDIALQIVKAGAILRANYKKGDIPYGPSVGDLVNWATLVADGMDIYTAAEETVVTTTSDDTSIQDAVRRLVKAAGANKNPDTSDAEKSAQ